MGTPSRVKGGLQEIRTVVELMETTVRSLTDSSGPMECVAYTTRVCAAEWSWEVATRLV